MSKTKPKKIVKSEKSERGKSKDLGDSGGKREERRDDAEVKPVKAESQWSDWIWDEGLSLYYRAKHEKGDDWRYEYSYPLVHPAAKNEPSSFIPEKIDYPKVEEKVIYVEPEKTFEVPNSRGSEYLVSVCEELKAVGPGGGGGGGGGGGETKKPAGGEGGNSEAKPVVKVDAGGSTAPKGNGEGKSGGGKEEKKSGSNLEKSFDNKVSNGAVKKQPEKEKSKKKDRDKRHERKESRHKDKERRK